MKCADEKTWLKLGDFVTGHLDSAERQEVERHLEVCEHCRTNLKVMQLLQKSQAEPAASGHEEHLSQEEITSYYENRRGLPVAVRSRIEEHMKGCAKCAYDLAFLNDLETELSASVRSELDSPTVWHTFMSYLVLPLRKPAVAYFLLLLTAYPAVRWFVDSPSNQGTVGLPGSIAQVFQLTEMRRSGSEPTVIQRTDSDPLVRVDLPFYHLMSENRYEYSLVDSETKESWPITFFASYGESGKIQLVLDTKLISDGLYELVVAEISFNDSLDVNESSFSFRLMTTR